MAGGSTNAQRGRGGAQDGKGARAEPAEASAAAPAATDGQHQDEEPAQSAAASGGDQGSSAARGGRPVKQPQLEPKGVRDARQAFLQYCRGQPQAIAKMVQQEPTRLTQLVFSRVQLAEACLHASKDDFVEFQEVLHSSVHDALRHAVGAAAHDQQPSLLGVAYAITLLRLLHGQPAFAERQASWQRLADRFPPPLRQELTPAHFVPPDQEAMGVGLLDMDWPLDAAVLQARNKVNGLAAWAEQQIKDLQDVLNEGLEADERESAEWKHLHRTVDPSREELHKIGMKRIEEMFGAIPNRLSKAVLLPRRHCGMLATRLVHEARLKELEMKRTEAARRQLQEEVQRRQQQLSQQRVQRVQELQQRTRQLLSRAEQLSEEEQQRLVQEVGRAGIRTAQLAGFLSSEVQAACEPGGGGSGSGGAERRQLSALLRLASMPLAELARQLLAAPSPPPQECQPAALDSLAGATRAMRAVLAGEAGVEYRLPGGLGIGDGCSRRTFELEMLRLTGKRELLSSGRTLFEQAGLARVLRCLDPGGATTQLPAKAPLHLCGADALDLPESLAHLQRPEVHPSDGEVLLEVPPWRAQPAGGAPAAADGAPPAISLHCTDDPLARLLFELQQDARTALARLGDMSQERGLQPLLDRMRGLGARADECLAKVLAGHVMLQAVMAQEEAASTAGGLRCLSPSSLSDSDATDSDDSEGGEGEGQRPGGAQSQRAAVNAEVASRLAIMQLALCAPPFEAMESLLSFCVGARVAMDQACDVVNAARRHALEPPFAFHPVEEGGQLLLAVLPIQHQLPKLAEVGDGPPTPDVRPALTEARTAVLQFILAALRLLQSRDRLPTVLVSLLHDYFAAAAECRGVELHAEPGGEDGSAERLPFELLAVLPLRDLLNLYSFLCGWLMDTFAAGPVDLHPAIEEAVIRAVSGGQLSPPPVAPPPLGSQPRAAAASRQASLLSVTTLGLCQMVGQAEKWGNPTGLLEGAIRPTWPSRRLPQQMPPAVKCAEALAGRAGGLEAALQAAANSLDVMLDVDERSVMFAQIRQLAVVRWWQQLLDRSAHSVSVEQDALEEMARGVAKGAQAGWQTAAIREPEAVREALCGSPGQQGALEGAHQTCMQAATKYVTSVSDTALTQQSLRALANCVSAAMLRQHAVATAGSSRGAEDTGFDEAVREVVADLDRDWQVAVKLLIGMVGALEENKPPPPTQELAVKLATLSGNFELLRQEAATGTARQLVVMSHMFVSSLRSLHAKLETALGELAQAEQALGVLHWAATCKVHALLGRLRFKCATSALEVLTQHMVEHALPERWEREIKAQQKQQKQQAPQQAEARRASPAGAEALPPLPPEAPQAGTDDEPSAPPLPSGGAGARSGSAGASSGSSQPPERGGRGKQGKAAAAAPAPAAAQQVTDKEREAALKALLEEEEQEERRKKEKAAKQKQREEEDKKRKAAQAKAAQAAAAAKRKAEEAAAAEAEAARAAEEAKREAERQQQEREARRKKADYEAMIAAQQAAEEEERRVAAAAAAAQRAAAAAAAAEARRAQQAAAAEAQRAQQAEGEQSLAAATPQPKPAREQRGCRQGRRQDKPAADAGAQGGDAGAEARAASSSKRPAAATPSGAAAPGAPQAAVAAAVAAEPETPAPSAAAAGKRRGSAALAEPRPASPEASADRPLAQGQQAGGAAPASAPPAAAQQAQQGKSRRKPKAASPQLDEASEQRPGRALVEPPHSQAPPPPPAQQEKQQQRQPQAAQPGRRGRGRAEQRGAAEQAPASQHEADAELAAELAALPLGPDGEPDVTAVEALFQRQEARRAGRTLSPPPAAAAVHDGWAAGAGAAEAAGGRQPAAPAHGAQVAAPAGAPSNHQAAGPASAPSNRQTAAPSGAPSNRHAAAPAAPAGRGRQVPAEQAPGVGRFTSWIGAWVCACGKQHAKLSESCSCGGKDPCWNWFYGEPCKVGPRSGQCGRPHLLFDLPSKPTKDELINANFNNQKLRPPHLKPDPKFVYKPPAKPAAPAARPRSQAAPAAREQPPAAAAAGTAGGAASVPAGPRPAWPRPPAKPAAADRSSSSAVSAAAVPRPEPEPTPQQQPQQPAASAPAPLPHGYQPAAELPGVASLFPPVRQPPPAAQGAAATHAPGVPSGLPALVPPAAAAAVPAVEAAADFDVESLLLSLGVGSDAVEQQAQPPVAAPLLPGLVPASAGWAGSSAGGAPALQQQQQQQQPPQPQLLPWEALHLPGAGGSWGAAEQAPSAAVVEASHELQQQVSWSVAGESQEDAELQAAIQASLVSASADAVQHQAGAWQQVGGHGQPGPAQPEAGAAAEAGGELSLAGMRNETGEYNCFINVIIQCLWRCAEFRHQVASWDAGFRGADPVLQAVFRLFQQFEAQEAARRADAGLMAVDPTPLREALAALPGHNFRVGEMNDAAEVLLVVYEKAMDVAKAQGCTSGIDQTFGLQVHEAVNCGQCWRVTQQSQYTQYFHNTQATTLRTLRGMRGSLGALLAEAEAQHRKSCDTDVGGCGQPNPVTHVLQAAPRVFTLQVAWESHNEAPQDIAATLAAIRETVDLGEVYSGVPPGAHRYTLRSMVCYYGAHYQALVLVPDAGGWLMFDDTRVSCVGSWQQVRRKCEAGRIQPSVLFYEAA